MISYSLASSANGWTDSEIALDWIREIFDPETRREDPETKRLLILDGHVSHCSLKFILYAEKQGITVLLLPAHCTHRLQPLDVGIFGPLSKAWSRVVREFQGKGYNVTKYNFLSIYAPARQAVMTPDNIISSWRRCGIVPYDPSVITEEDTAPAERTSCRASQPLTVALPAWLEEVSRDEDATPSCPENTSAPCTLDLSPHMPIAQEIHLPIRKGLTEVSINVPRLRTTDLPKFPSKWASHKEKDTYIKELHSWIERAVEEKAEHYARLRLADIENGRIREIAYGKSLKRGKTMPLKTGARILTAADQIGALCEADRKRAMGAVLKQMKPILNSMAKSMNQHEQEKETERVEKEKAELKAAKSNMDEAKKDMEKLEKKIKVQQNGLEKAEERLRKTSTPSQWQKENKSCRGWRSKLNPLLLMLEPASTRYNTARQIYDAVVATRDARLAELQAIDDRYQAALEEEEKDKQLVQEQEDAEKLRRSKLPQRPKDAVNLWTERWAAFEMPDSLTKDDQESVRLSPEAIRVPRGHYVDMTQTLPVPSGTSVEPVVIPQVVTNDSIDPVFL